MPLPNYAPSSNKIMPVPKKAEVPPVYEPNIHDPTTRADLMKYWIPLSLDDKTAQKLLWISESNLKVSRMSEEVCPYPMRPERYEHSPQVLCKEGLLGQRGYWEVDYGGWVVIGAVYESMGRKEGQCGLGENESSWGAGWAGSCYQVWHNGENVEVGLPLCNTMSIYLDQPAGIIKFFIVEGEEEAEKAVRLIHKFKTNLKEKILPCFWVGSKSFCWIRKKEGQEQEGCRKGDME
ncbi:tripartite motif-containing protein 16-like isoform X2 [Oncorhynchus kisutch]|uniref:Zgc:195001 n=1 Tax=Oncorhynchus kisutch TaxID=8019 RepID=A0A8C7IA45_ONCKI|nr:tripartite motif-containing protein 16-like isoform X2 [Oncorhynchus kisutch]